MKAIIFDIDNTLIELRDEFVSSMKDVLIDYFRNKCIMENKRKKFKISNF